MKADLWRRLNKAQSELSTEDYLFTVLQEPGEALEDTEVRLDAWRNGAKDDGITAKPINDGEIIVVCRSFL